MENKILVVEDESSIRKFIQINLIRNGFEVLEAVSAEQALELLNHNNVDVVVLDVMLPGMDGFEACEKIRSKHPETAIIMLTARSQDMDKIMGLDMGADDYMIKPFNPLELVARIRSILRRTHKPNAEEPKNLTLQNLTLQLELRKLYKDGQEIRLTPREFDLLRLLFSNPAHAFSRDDLLNEVWGRNYIGDLKTVDVHIRRLREKIERDPSEPIIIQTVWGFGYVCRESDQTK